MSLKKRSLITIALGLSLLSSACEPPSYREQFFTDRPCKAIKYSCLNESQEQSQEKTMTTPKKTYVLTADDQAGIKQRKTLRMYDEITQMLDIYYPGFWADKADDTDFKIAWVANVDKISKRYYPKRKREDLEKIVLICAIVGSDFEQKPELGFIVKRLTADNGVALSPILVYNWLNFELLQKDYSNITGTQYNTWSLRGARLGMPPVTRKIPSFSHEWLPDNLEENKLVIYLDTVKNGGRKNIK